VTTAGCSLGAIFAVLALIPPDRHGRRVGTEWSDRRGYGIRSCDVEYAAASRQARVVPIPGGNLSGLLGQRAFNSHQDRESGLERGVGLVQMIL
jgi:hypothetical protein